MVSDHFGVNGDTHSLSIGHMFSYFNPGSGPTLSYCHESEQKLIDCLYNTGTYSYHCYHNRNIAVSCQGQCSTDGDLRLVDGSRQSSGRVVVCLNGQWGTVCDNYWDTRDTRVVCRQLGYHSGESIYDIFIFIKPYLLVYRVFPKLSKCRD